MGQSANNLREVMMRFHIASLLLVCGLIVAQPAPLKVNTDIEVNINGKKFPVEPSARDGNINGKKFPVKEKAQRSMPQKGLMPRDRFRDTIYVDLKSHLDIYPPSAQKDAFVETLLGMAGKVMERCRYQSEYGQLRIIFDGANGSSTWTGTCSDLTGRFMMVREAMTQKIKGAMGEDAYRALKLTEEDETNFLQAARSRGNSRQPAGAA